MNQNRFKVYLNGKLIDEVFYNEGCSRNYVRNSLINRDGYDPEIKVVKTRKIIKFFVKEEK